MKLGREADETHVGNPTTSSEAIVHIKGSSLMNITDRKDKCGCKTSTEQDIFWPKEGSDKNPRGFNGGAAELPLEDTKNGQKDPERQELYKLPALECSTCTRP
ncbi:hypothetical protein BGZ89_003978 [Linnemannia elongata]|nr:hypothetical protein BGZ89_003978 [Linnemannia elongata]